MPFVCGARNLGEALRRIAEGAAMIRTKGEAGTGNVVEAVRHMRTITLADRRRSRSSARRSWRTRPRSCGAPLELVRGVAATGKLPVVNFSAGGISTPADAALMMQLGVDGELRRLGHLQVRRTRATMAKAIVEATTHFNDPDILAKVSRGIGDPMAGLEIGKIGEENLLQTRGW